MADTKAWIITPWKHNSSVVCSTINPSHNCWEKSGSILRHCPLYFSRFFFCFGGRRHGVRMFFLNLKTKMKPSFPVSIEKKAFGLNLLSCVCVCMPLWIVFTRGMTFFCRNLLEKLLRLLENNGIRPRWAIRCSCLFPTPAVELTHQFVGFVWLWSNWYVGNLTFHVFNVHHVNIQHFFTSYWSVVTTTPTAILLNSVLCRWSWSWSTIDR